MGSHSPTSSSPSAPCRKPGYPFLTQLSPRGGYSGCPAICPRAINPGRAGLPPSCVESLKGGGPGSRLLQGTLERARAQGTWADAARRAGLSCCCSGAPAPPVSPWTRAPSDGNSGQRGWQGRGAPTSRTLLAFRCVMPSSPRRQLGMEAQSHPERPGDWSVATQPQWPGSWGERSWGCPSSLCLGAASAPG